MEPANEFHKVWTTNPAPWLLGQILVTEQAGRIVTDAEVLSALDRHQETHRGKFVANPSKEGSQPEDVQLLSSHRTHGGEKFWVLTDAGHRITTLLLPSEY